MSEAKKEPGWLELVASGFVAFLLYLVMLPFLIAVVVLGFIGLVVLAVLAVVAVPIFLAYEWIDDGMSRARTARQQKDHEEWMAASDARRKKTQDEHQEWMDRFEKDSLERARKFKEELAKLREPKP